MSLNFSVTHCAHIGHLHSIDLGIKHPVDPFE